MAILSVFTIIISSSCLMTHPQEHDRYLLAKGGFSPNTTRILFSLQRSNESSTNDVYLGIYDLLTRNGKYLFPITPNPFDYAWEPEKDAFVVTHGDRITFFESKDSNGTYVGESVRCPVNFNYMYCSWSPDGNWLAVNAYNLVDASGNKLCLFNPATATFQVTEIATGYHAPFWQDRNTLYVSDMNVIKEVKITSGVPQVTKTFNLRTESTWFYGIVGERPLTLYKNILQLGETELLTLDYSRRGAVLWTGTYIFVAQTQNNLVVFDDKGREVCRTNPGQLIRFGSIGENLSTVYGVAGNMLFHLSVQDNSIRIEKICDLSRF